MGGVDADADHDDADEERDQRRQHQIVDGAGEIGGQHADEMHRPDAGRERQRRSGEREAPAEPLGRIQFAGERQADETALDGDGDRKRHEPWLVWNGHSAPPLRVSPAARKVTRASRVLQRLTVVFKREYRLIADGRGEYLGMGAVNGLRTPAMC